jgi:tetratricopeptide (TPR) repeat protein
MSHLRWYWIVVCSAGLLLTSCGGKKTAETIKAESQKSVALISHLKGHGVGFFIEGSSGVCTLLTAKHVVPNGQEISILTMTSKLPFKPMDIRRANNADLAVVTFKPLDGNCPFPALKLGDSKDVVLNQPIYISSYPGGVNGQPPKRSFYPSNVSDRTPGGADGYEIGYKTDTFGGTSGSPVLNEFGEVIAVHGRSYLNKDSNSSPNDRAYLDLGVPIDLYRRDAIAKISPQKSPDQKGSIANLNIFEFGVKEWVIFTILVIVVGMGSPFVLLGTFKIIEIIGIFIRTYIFKPRTASGYTQLGDAKKSLGREKEAISDYKKAIAIKPRSSYDYSDRGKAKEKLGNIRFVMTEEKLRIIKDAIADYDKAIELKPDFDWFYKNRGDAKLKLGMKEEAIADYDKAIELDPDCIYFYESRGDAKVAVGDKEGAKMDYQKVVELAIKDGKRGKWSKEKALDKIEKLGI